MAQLARFRFGSTPLTCFALISLAIALALNPVEADNDEESSVRTSSKTLTRLKTFNYLEPNAGLSLDSRRAKEAIKSGKIIQNLRPLEYDIELDFSESGKYQSKINGQMEIYVQFAGSMCEPKKKKKSALSKTIKGMAEAISCKSKQADQIPEGLRLITLHVGEGVTVRDLQVEVGASIDALKRNSGERISVESQQLNELTRVLSITLARPFELNSFGRLKVRFESSLAYDFVRYSNKRTGPKEPPTSPLEAFANFRFTQASTERTFPCVNSPKFKSTIRLAIVADRKLRAYSNMPASDVHDDPKGRRNTRGKPLRRTVFAPTPPMPIHRLIYSLGPYEKESSSRATTTATAAVSGQPRVRLVAPADLGGAPTRSHFALELAQAALDWMSRKVGRKLPIKQLDLVATHAHHFNVTSSLGCALIDANQLLLDPVESSPETKLLVAWNVALVVAQQWFGGLVTERRWRDHWILDGLAGQLALEMLHELRPEMGVHHYVRSHLLTRAMYIRAIRFGDDDDEMSEELKQKLVRELLQLSYIKSTAIVGMLKTLAGPGKFQTILETLVQRGASDQSSANSDNLLVDQEGLVVLMEKSDFLVADQKTDLKSFIDAWRNHPSFPVLSVQTEPSNPDKAIQLYQTPVHKLTQAEIGLRPNRNGVQIPLRVLFNDRQGTRRHTEHVDEAFKEVRPGEVPKWNGQLVEAPEWFHLLDDDSGNWLKLLADPDKLAFFIVHYTNSGNIARRLKAAIENFAMGAEDRSSLLRDATILLQVKPELQTSVPYEELASWFQNERVIQVIDAQLKLDRAIQANEDTKKPPILAVRLFERHGFSPACPQEGEFEQLVRSSALLDLVQSGHKPAIETALKIFEQDPVRAESALLKPAIYAALAKAGGHKQLETLLQRLSRSKWPEEIDRLRVALEQANSAEIRSEVSSWCEAHNCQV